MIPKLTSLCGGESPDWRCSLWTLVQRLVLVGTITYVVYAVLTAAFQDREVPAVKTPTSCTSHTLFFLPRIPLLWMSAWLSPVARDLIYLQYSSSIPFSIWWVPSLLFLLTTAPLSRPKLALGRRMLLNWCHIEFSLSFKINILWVGGVKVEGSVKKKLSNDKMCFRKVWTNIFSNCSSECF